MPINVPTELNFLYRFEAGSQVFTYTDQDRPQSYNGETYEPALISHTPPTFSGEAQDSEVDVTMLESTGLVDVFLEGPPAYRVKLQVYEFDRTDESVSAYYRGWVVRSACDLDGSVVTLHCKSVWLFFERESLSDSLSSLSRYSIYDPRSGVDTSALGVEVTVTAFNDERDRLTVTGIVDIDGWYTGGFIVAPNQDKRTILDDVTETGDRHLYLNAAFPQFTLGTGFNAEVFPGDNLEYDTWATKFPDETDRGEKWGGWQYTPNVDPAKKGVI